MWTLFFSARDPWQRGKFNRKNSINEKFPQIRSTQVLYINSCSHHHWRFGVANSWVECIFRKSGKMKTLIFFGFSVKIRQKFLAIAHVSWFSHQWLARCFFFFCFRLFIFYMALVVKDTICYSVNRVQFHMNFRIMRKAGCSGHHNKSTFSLPLFMQDSHSLAPGQICEWSEERTNECARLCGGESKPACGRERQGKKPRRFR